MSGFRPLAYVAITSFSKIEKSKLRLFQYFATSVETPQIHTSPLLLLRVQDALTLTSTLQQEHFPLFDFIFTATATKTSDDDQVLGPWRVDGAGCIQYSKVRWLGCHE